MTWLYIPSPYVPESECSTKDCVPDASFLASSSALSVTLKGKPLQPQRLLSTWNRGSWIKRLSGLTLSHSTAQRGADAWIASLPVFHASRTQLQVSAKARTMKDGSGKTSLESSATFLLGSFFSKTSGDYFPVVDSRLSSHRWSPSGSILCGEYWPRPKLELLTNASEFSYWPTVTVCGNNNRTGLTAKSSDGLATAAKSWATSTASDYKRGDYPGDQRRNSPCVATQAARWPTPDVCSQVRDMSKISPDRQRNPKTKVTIGLPTAVANWPTPCASDCDRGGTQTANMSGQSLTQTVNTYTRQALIQPTGQTSLVPHPTSPQRLNPAFVCQLMGWPWWWTHPDQIKSAPVEMALYRYKLQVHLSHLFNAQESRERAA
jgi:hypothetical protein